MIPPRPLDSHGRTDPGRVRESNEDHFLVAHLTKEMTIDGTSLDLEGGASLASDRVGGLFLVADGVAGRAAGEQASALAIETVRNHVLHTMPWFLRLGAEDDRERLVEALQRALAASNRVVRSAGRDARCHGMATTLTMAYVLWPRAFVVHVGDSRCYLVRDARIEAITRDHTVAQNLQDEGLLGPDEARRSRFHHVLWNAIGVGDGEVEPDIHCLDLCTGDALLLCTDGLTRHLSDEDLLDAVDAGASAREITDRLVREAIEAGGEDNVTVVTVLFPPDDAGGARLDPLRADPAPTEHPTPRVPPAPPAPATPATPAAPAGPTGVTPSAGPSARAPIEVRAR